MNSTETQEKINTYNKQKAKLKNKIWFRFFVVIYWLVFIFFTGMVLILAISSGDQEADFFFWGIMTVSVVFWIIKKVGYYIMLGSAKAIQPDEDQILKQK